MQDSTPGINAEKDDTRTRLIGEHDREATIRIDTPLSDQEQTPTPEPTPSTNAPQRRKTWIYVVIALVVIAAGAVAAFLLLGNDDKSNAKSPETAEIDEVPGVNDADMGDFLNTAMGARYDKSTDDAAIETPAAAEDSVAVAW